MDIKFPHFISLVFNLYVYFLKVIFFIQIFSLAEEIEAWPLKMLNLEKIILDCNKSPLLVISLIGNHYRNMPRSAKKALLEKIYPFLIPIGLDYF